MKRPQAVSAAAETVDMDAGGVRCLLRRNEANEVLALRVYVWGGCLELAPESAGIESLYGRAARRGTARFPKERLNAEIARTGVGIATGVGEDFSVFKLTCLKRHFETAWALFSEVLLRPLLDAREVDLVRQQMLAEIRQRNDSPDGRLAQLAREHAYPNHPYAVDPEGTEAALQQLGGGDLRAHMQQVLDKHRLAVVAVGDFEPGDLQARVHEALAGLPCERRPVTAPPLAYAQAHLRVEQRDLPTNYIIGQFVAPPMSAATYPAMLLAMSLLRDRFFEEVRTKRNLSYAPAAGLGNNAANLGYVYVTAVDPETTLGVMLAEMRRLRDQPLPQKELDDKVRVYVTRYYLQNESNQAQAGFLGAYELLGGGWAASQEFVSRLQALRPEDIQSAVAAAFRNMQYSFLGNAELARPEIFVDP